MRDSLTGQTIFNTNQMTKSVDDRPVILVESDADLSIVVPHVKGQVARCAPGFSRTATLEAADLHLQNGDDWVIAVVDRDVRPPAAAKNVVVTVLYDLEAEVLLMNQAKAKRYIYSHAVSEGSYRTVTVDHASQIFDEAVLIASTIGWMRRYAHLNEMGVSMNKLPMSVVIQNGTPGDYVSSAVDIACVRAGEPAAVTALESAARSGLRDSERRLHVCNGHDLLDAMVVLIKRVAGHKPSSREFARGMHAMLDCFEFVLLSIFAPLQKWYWELANTELWDCSVEVN